MSLYQIENSTLIKKMVQDKKDDRVIKVVSNTVVVEMLNTEQQVKETELLLSYFCNITKTHSSSRNGRFVVVFTFDEIDMIDVITNIFRPVTMGVEYSRNVYLVKPSKDSDVSLFKSTYYSKQHLLSLLGNTSMVVEGSHVEIAIETK